MSVANLDRVYPHNLEAERSVLGAIMLREDAYVRAAAFVRPTDFYRDAHRRIFEKMAVLSERGVSIDLTTLREELSRSVDIDAVGGPAYISTLIDGVPRSTNVEHYAEIVREKSRLRELISVATKAVANGYEAKLSANEIAEETTIDLASLAETNRATAVKSKDAIQQYMEALVAGNIADPLPTGYSDFDHLTGGFRPEDLTIVAARPSVGKSSWTLGAARNLAAAGKPTIVFSIEMRQHSLAAQLLAWRSGVSASLLSRGLANPAQSARVLESVESEPDIPLWIVTSAATLGEIAAISRRFRDDHGVICVVIDYLQMLVPERNFKSENDAVTAISKGLKRLAKDLKVSVVALSQLSRAPEGRQDKRPHLSDLRASGALEQDADMAILLFREEMHKRTDENAGIAEVIVAKDRTGPTGVVKQYFNRDLAKFGDLAV